MDPMTLSLWLALVIALAVVLNGLTLAAALRAFKNAGPDSQRAQGVLVHGFRHALMKLLGHELMVTSQRYVDGASTQNRAATAQHPLYRPD